MEIDARVWRTRMLSLRSVRTIPFRNPRLIRFLSSSTVSSQVESSNAASHSGSRDYGSVPEFTTRWTRFFSEEAYDQFELLRGLNNCFSYDIVPPVPVVEAALRAARRLGDFATAVRVFGGIREKVDGKAQWETYMEQLADIKAELGIPTPEELGRG